MKIHTHPINELFEEVKNLNYPDNIKKVPALLSNFAFFPGGTGLWKTTSDQDWPQIPKGGVMVLAHNFGSTKYYDKCREEWGGDNLNSATWRNLSDLLEKTSVDLGKCFFTNVYFGLRTDDKETGFFPGSKNQEWGQA